MIKSTVLQSVGDGTLQTVHGAEDMCKRQTSCSSDIFSTVSAKCAHFVEIFHCCATLHKCSAHVLANGLPSVFITVRANECSFYCSSELLLLGNYDYPVMSNSVRCRQQMVSCPTWPPMQLSCFYTRVILLKKGMSWGKHTFATSSFNSLTVTQVDIFHIKKMPVCNC